MYSVKRTICLAILACCTNAHAEGYVLGLGVDGDSAEGRSISAFGDFGVGEETWLAVMANSSRTEGFLRSNDTILADVGIDHWFDPVGVRFGATYWGNSDILDSRDLRASVYARGKVGSFSLDYQKRNFEFDLQSDLLRGRTVEFSADGVGFSTRLSLGENLSFQLGGMSFDYSRNLRIQPDIDVLAFVSASRLSMVNSLIDDRINAGLDFKFGLRSIDVTVGRWQTAVDGSEVDSYSIGFLTPVSDRVDMEFRLALDESETFGQTTSFSFYVYYFGGA